MDVSQFSPGFRNINVVSTTHHPDESLHNIKEIKTDESPDSQDDSPDKVAHGPPCGSAMMNTSFTDFYEQNVDAYEPISSELITANMCLSTLYLH